MSMPYEIKKFGKKKLILKIMINNNYLSIIQNNSKRNLSNKNMSKNYVLFLIIKTSFELHIYTKRVVKFAHIKILKAGLKKKFSKNNSSRGGKPQLEKYIYQNKIKKTLFKLY